MKTKLQNLYNQYHQPILIGIILILAVIVATSCTQQYRVEKTIGDGYSVNAPK